jgi:hypothetical protein
VQAAEIYVIARPASIETGSIERVQVYAMAKYARVSAAAAPLHAKLHAAQESLDEANAHLALKQKELQVQTFCFLFFLLFSVFSLFYVLVSSELPRIVTSLVHQQSSSSSGYSPSFPLWAM